VARENVGAPLAVIQDESIDRIRDVYVNKFDAESAWWFCCWLDLTEEGQKVAEALEASRDSVLGS
jgi:hypothetical protein